MLEANKELVRRHFEEIWNQQNLGVADELMADDYVEHAVAPFGQAEPGRVNGPAAMRQTAEWLLSQFPDLRMTVEAMVAEGDMVAVRVLSEGTNLGRSTAWCRRRGSGSRRVRATGSGLRMASWPSTGRPVKTFRRCCSWASCSSSSAACIGARSWAPGRYLAVGVWSSPDAWSLGLGLFARCLVGVQRRLDLTLFDLRNDLDEQGHGDVRGTPPFDPGPPVIPSLRPASVAPLAGRPIRCLCQALHQEGAADATPTIAMPLAPPSARPIESATPAAPHGAPKKIR
jgi:ketosteroid isomerase-like protein